MMTNRIHNELGTRIHTTYGRPPLVKDTLVINDVEYRVVHVAMVSSSMSHVTVVKA